jgi:hypothetical protein
VEKLALDHKTLKHALAHQFEVFVSRTTLRRNVCKTSPKSRVHGCSSLIILRISSFETWQEARMTEIERTTTKLLEGKEAGAPSMPPTTTKLAQTKQAAAPPSAALRQVPDVESKQMAAVKSEYHTLKAAKRELRDKV